MVIGMHMKDQYLLHLGLFVFLMNLLMPYILLNILIYPNGGQESLVLIGVNALYVMLCGPLLVLTIDYISIVKELGRVQIFINGPLKLGKLASLRTLYYLFFVAVLGKNMEVRLLD